MTFQQTITSMFTSKRNSIFLSAALLVVCSAATIVVLNANFSGEWTLNTGKSDLGQYGGRMAAKKIKIDGQPDAISFEKSNTNQNGDEVTTKEKLTFDGKESESVAFGTSKRKSSAKWSDDGQTLNVNSTIFLDRNGEITEIKVAEVWKLIDNGNAISLESTSNSSFGTNTMKLVYDKVKP